MSFLTIFPCTQVMVRLQLALLSAVSRFRSCSNHWGTDIRTKDARQDGSESHSQRALHALSVAAESLHAAPCHVDAGPERQGQEGNHSNDVHRGQVALAQYDRYGE